MSAQTDDTANADHVRWLAETWQMIEQCAVSRDVAKRVGLSNAGCAALRDERDRLRALNAELLAAVEKAASECAECDGKGTWMGPDLHTEPCDDCADLRALIARAKGEA